MTRTRIQQDGLASGVPSKASIGLGNVDNTSDASKPISTAVQTALDGKAASSHAHSAADISDSTAAGRAILTAADAAAQRTAMAVPASASPAMSGTATVSSSGGAAASVSVVSDGGAASTSVARYTDDSVAANYALRKNRGSLASPAAVQASDQLGLVTFQTTNDAGTNGNVARIIATAAAAPVSGQTSVASNIAMNASSGASALNRTLSLQHDGSVLASIQNASAASYPAFFCRAWVNFNGTGTVAIRASGNVTSITDNGVGNYTVNLTTAMPDANYAIAGAVDQTLASSWFHYETIVSATSSSFTVLCARIDNGSLTADPTTLRYAIFR